MLAWLRSFDRCAIALAVAIALVALARRLRRAAAASGSSTTVATNSGTGTVAVVVTDAATDEFLQIWVTVRKVELIGAQGHFTLFEGRRVFDLLSMRDDARLLSLGRDVPAGDWSKIRLHVEDVRADPARRGGATRERSSTCPAGRDARPGLRLRIDPPEGRRERQDRPESARADHGARRASSCSSSSISTRRSRSTSTRPATSASCSGRSCSSTCSRVRPDRLVRIEGTIAEIDLAAQKLLVCGTHLVFRANAQQDLGARSRCVDVRIGADDFDLRRSTGSPPRSPISTVGDEIAAVGRFRAGTGETLVFDALWIQQGGFDAGIAVTGEVLTGVVGGEFDDRARPGGPDRRSTSSPCGCSRARSCSTARASRSPRATSGRACACASSACPPARPERLDASLVFVARARGSRAATRNGDAAVRRRGRHARDPGRDADDRRAGLRGDRERRRRVPDHRSGRSAALRSHRAGRSPAGRGGRRVRPVRTARASTPTRVISFGVGGGWRTCRLIASGAAPRRR